MHKRSTCLHSGSLRMGYSNCTSPATTECSDTSLSSLSDEREVIGVRPATDLRTRLYPATNDVFASVVEEEDDLDVYGQTHPIETEDLIQKSLHDFHAILEQVPNKKKHNVLQAQLKCPQMLTDSFKLMFLRCECYNTELAVKRYMNYWDKRVDAFGPSTAFGPLTLSGALRDDTVPLELGAMQIIRRNKCRDILYFDPSKLDKTKYTRESGLRAFWYFFHALLEDEEVQKRGIIILNFNRHYSNSNRDPQFTKLCFNAIKGVLPIRLSVVHGCHVPFGYSCVIALVLFFLGDRLRKRILVHNGTDEHVLMVLQNQYRIAAEHIPIDMGGTLQLNVHAWLEERRSRDL